MWVKLGYDKEGRLMQKNLETGKFRKLETWVEIFKNKGAGMKLSKAQQRVLDKMQPGEWYSAYDLKCRIDTLISLRKRGLVESRGENTPGALAMTRTHVKFRKEDISNAEINPF
jgi:hypothetical protein